MENLLQRVSQKLRRFSPIIFKHVKAGILVALILLGTIANAQPTVHDPSTVIKNTDGKYYTFTTHWGVGTVIATDPDFINYEYGSNAFADTATYPSWIDEYVDNFDAYYWAPDVVKMNGYYYLYYSCSNMGSPKSAIGVAKSTDLAGPWEDLGKVVSSSVTTDINAIDPGILKDNGKVWMVYGSYMDGIGIIELDSTTAKPKTGAQVTKLAGGNNQAIEGSYIIKNGGYYYLFTANGGCCNGLNSTYYTMVARSTSITGPYTGWRTFLPNQDGSAVLGPGHIAYGEGRLTYHYYSKDHNGEPKLKVRTDFGFHNGWPYVGPPPSQLPVTDGGVYRITPRHSSKALDVASCGTANGTNVQQWSWLNNDCQKWRFTDLGGGAWRISPLNAPDMALDLSSCSLSNAANIQLWTWLDNDCQKWKLVDRGNGYYSIQNLLSGKCLDINGVSSNDGTNVDQWTYSAGNQHQEFTFQPIADGNYMIKAVHSGKYMSVAGFSSNNGAVIEQWQYLDQDNLKFEVSMDASGYYSFSPVYNTKVIDVSGVSTSNGAAIALYTDEGANNQKYIITSVGAGQYRISPKHASTKALAIGSSSPDNGADVILWDYLGSNNFKWVFESVSGSSARVANAEVLNTVEGKTGILVYPNPSYGQIHITNPEQKLLNIQLLDLLGRRLKSFTITKDTEVNLGDLKSGTYMLLINEGKDTRSYKCVLLN